MSEPATHTPQKLRRVAVLGSTGSIGCNALEVIGHHPARLQAVALAARSQVDKLVQQCVAHRCAMVSVADEATRDAIRERVSAEIVVGAAGLEQIASHANVDIVLAAMVGAAGLPSILAAVRSGKTVALANKETLVMAGGLVMKEAKHHGVRILPVDSEHSAAFQAMSAGRISEVRRVILTASGGPFRTWSVEAMAAASVESALRHPTWQMGRKISIDSATMFNKALEIIEAAWLFDLPADKIEVLIHPESIVHSMVEYVDGSVIAQMSPPDMKSPIQYALLYPDRISSPAERLNTERPFNLHFEPPDMQRFPALRLGYEAAATRGTMGAVMNAANEVAVEAFLTGQLAFGRIAAVVEETMTSHSVLAEPSLETLMFADGQSRITAAEIIRKAAVVTSAPL